MSFIRALSERKYSKGSSGLYVYPTENPKTKEQLIEGLGDRSIPTEDFVEIMFRILERGGLEFSLKQINRVRESLYLEPLDKITGDYEVNKAYFDMMGIIKAKRFYVKS